MCCKFNTLYVLYNLLYFFLFVLDKLKENIEEATFDLLEKIITKLKTRRIISEEQYNNIDINHDIDSIYIYR